MYCGDYDVDMLVIQIQWYDIVFNVVIHTQTPNLYLFDLNDDYL